MSDLNGFNDTPFTATHLGAVAFRASGEGEGTQTRLQATDSVGLYTSFAPSGGVPGSDTVDYFSFLPSGLDTVTFTFDGAQSGTYANLLMILPISGVSKVSGPVIGTWLGGIHARSNTDYANIATGAATDFINSARNGVFNLTADMSDATWAPSAAQPSAVWTLDGTPVFFEVVGFQLDGTFGSSTDSTVQMSDIDYTFSIAPQDRALVQPGRDSLLFSDTYGLSETHTGEASTDTYLFSGNMDDLALSFLSGDRIIATHLSLPTAPDTLIDIERIQTGNGTLAFDVDGKAGQAYRLYEAAFDREPDAPGLGFWIGHYDAGNVDLVQMAELFMQSPEFTSLYGAANSLDDRDFLTVLYANVLDRAPDDPGFAFWRNQQENGLSRAEMLQYFSESTENYQNVIGTIDDGIFFI